MRRFAQTTDVPVERTRAEIDRILVSNGQTTLYCIFGSPSAGSGCGRFERWVVKIGCVLFACAACGSPFEASDPPTYDAALDVRVTEDAGREHDVVVTGRDAAKEGSPQVHDAGAHDASREVGAIDAERDTGFEHDAGRESGDVCIPAKHIDFSECPGERNACYTQPDTFCVYDYTTSTPYFVATPSECQCEGRYTCACVLKYYNNPCPPLDLKESCSDAPVTEPDGGATGTTEPIIGCET
jgi:hypothetical protein